MWESSEAMIEFRLAFRALFRLCTVGLLTEPSESNLSRCSTISLKSLIWRAMTALTMAAVAGISEEFFSSLIRKSLMYCAMAIWLSTVRLSPLYFELSESRRVASVERS